MTTELIDGVYKDVIEYFIQIYTNELYWLLNSIKSKCEELLEAAKVPEKGYTIQVDLNFHTIKLN